MAHSGHWVRARQFGPIGGSRGPLGFRNLCVVGDAMKTLSIGSSGVQGPLWGAAAEDWAAFQERTMLPVFEAVIARIEHWDVRVLDMGCGSGLFAERLIDSGMVVDGLDASEPLVAIARRVAPRARFRHG